MIRTRFSRAPWGLIGATVSVLLVESAIVGHDLDLTRPECINWRMSRRAADKKVRVREVLCFGTSMVQEGVLPRVIERETGKRTYNLAVCAGRADYDYYSLRRALAAGARPSAVLVDFHPGFLTASYRWGGGYSDVMSFGDCLDMAWTVGDADFLATTTLEKVLPSAYHRHEIRKSVLASLRGQPVSFGSINLQYIRNINRNQGAIVHPRDPGRRCEITDDYRMYFLGDSPWRCDPDEERYIHKFLALAAAHDIRVYWLVMPMIPAIQSGREARGHDDAYARFVDSFRRYDNLVVLDGRHAAYGPAAFKDACHLDSQGAYVFSKGIAEVLRRDEHEEGQGMRWVALAPYKARAIDVPLEDLKQSMLALRRGRRYATE